MLFSDSEDKIEPLDQYFKSITPSFADIKPDANIGSLIGHQSGKIVSTPLFVLKDIN